MLDDSGLMPYEGFLIGGSAIIRDATTREWRSLGTVYSANKSPVTEIKRIEGRVFASTEEAVQHDLELAKRWVDEQGIKHTK